MYMKNPDFAPIENITVMLEHWGGLDIVMDNESDTGIKSNKWNSLFTWVTVCSKVKAAYFDGKKYCYIENK